MSNIKKLDWYWRSGGGAQASLIPNIFSFSEDTTTAEVFWSFTGASEYVVRRSTNSDMSSPTTVYTGSNLDLTDTGLTSGVVYYYDVSADGGTPSAPCSVRTISFTPMTWYQFTGIIYNTDNKFGTATAAVVTKVKSIVTTGNDLTSSGGNLATSAKFGKKTYTVSDGTSTRFLLGTPLTFGDGDLDLGDFTVVVEFKILTTPVNHYYLDNTANANQWMRFQNLSALQFRVGTSGVLSQSFSSPLVLDKFYKIVIKRVSGFLYISTDGGVTFGAGVNVGTSPHTIDRISNTLNTDHQRLVIAGEELDQTAIDQVYNFLDSDEDLPFRSNSVPNISSDDFTLDFESGDFIVNSNFGLNATAASYRDRVYDVGDYSFILVNYKPDAPLYGEDFLVVINRVTGKRTDLISLGLTGVNNTDGHNNGSIVVIDNTIYHIESYIHYDNEPTGLLIKRFGDGFDLSNLQTLPINGRDRAQRVGIESQYHQTMFYDGKLFVLNQQADPSYLSNATYLGMETFTSPVNSTYRPIAIIAANYWIYFYVVHREDGILSVFINNFNNQEPDRIVSSFYIESADEGVTWRNKAQTWSKNIDTSGHIVGAELIANCYVKDATALAGHAKVSHSFYDPSDGEIYGVIGNGEDDGLQLFYWSGSAWVFKDIDTGSDVLEYNMLTSGDGANLPFAVRTGTNSYTVYCHPVNSGNWQIKTYTTTDKGDTWSEGSQISTDDTKQFLRMMPTKNMHYGSRKTLTALKKLNSTDTSVGVFYI